MLVPRKIKIPQAAPPEPDRVQQRAAPGWRSATSASRLWRRAYLTNRQIESARIAMTRHIKRGGKVWINVYPDRPLTKKPAETRMGSGKARPSGGSPTSSLAGCSSSSPGSLRTWPARRCAWRFTSCR